MPKTDHRVTLTDNKVKGIKLAKSGQRYQVMDSNVAGFGIRRRTFLSIRYRAHSPATKLTGCRSTPSATTCRRWPRWRKDR